VTRAPSPGTFEDLVSIVEVEIAQLLRLSWSPRTEPYWGRAAIHRFDDPTGEFGVLYAGDCLETAFAESVIHDNARFDVGTRRFQVPAGEFGREIARFSHPTLAVLPFADFAGASLKVLGLNADVCAGDDYAFSQAWSKAIHDGCPSVAGIRYPSRQHPGHVCHAVFERSGLRLADHRPLWATERVALCNRFNVQPVVA